MKILLLSIIIILLGFGVVHAGGFSIYEGNATWWGDSKVSINRQVEWSFTWNSLHVDVLGFSNGFRVYLSDQSDGSNVLDPGPGFLPLFYYTYYFNPIEVTQFSNDGFGADTIGFSASGFVEPVNIYRPVWKIITLVDSTTLGNYLCLDTSYFPPDGSWLWETPTGDYTPSWDGPHCYLIQYNPAFDVTHGSISVSDIEGGWDNDTKVATNRPITWSLRMDVPDDLIYAFSNGFRVYLSEDGTSDGIITEDIGFEPITAQTLVYFPGASYGVSFYGNDGFGADTIGFGTAGGFGGEPIDRHEDVWTITTQVEDNAIGSYLCLDSSYFPPGGIWLWAYANISGLCTPSWDGPHCYLIEECCQGIRGDVTGAEGILIDDLMYLRDFLFVGGHAPDCLKKGDVVIDGEILVNDLVFLVNYLFKGGDAPPQCE